MAVILHLIISKILASCVVLANKAGQVTNLIVIVGIVFLWDIHIGKRGGVYMTTKLMSSLFPEMSCSLSQNLLLLLSLKKALLYIMILGFRLLILGIMMI